MKFLFVEDELRTWWVEFRLYGMSASDNETVVAVKSKYNGVINNYDVAPEIVALGMMNKVGTRFNVVDFLATAATNLWRVTKRNEQDSPVVLRKATGHNFLSFSFPESVGVVGDVTINTTNHTVQVNVEADQAVTALVASFELTPGASAKISSTPQVSGTTSNNFTSPVTYIITNENGDTQNWTITVTKLSKLAVISAFVLAEQTGAATINNGDGTIAIEVAALTDVTGLTPTITKSAGATVLPLSGVSQDFTSPVVYTVTSQDLTVEKQYTVTVSVAT